MAGVESRDGTRPPPRFVVTLPNLDLRVSGSLTCHHRPTDTLARHPIPSRSSTTVTCTLLRVVDTNVGCPSVVPPPHVGYVVPRTMRGRAGRRLRDPHSPRLEVLDSPFLVVQPPGV